MASMLKMVAQRLTGQDEASGLHAEAEQLRARWRAALDEVDALEARKAIAATAAEFADIARDIAWQHNLADRHAADLAALDAKLNVAKAAARERLRRELTAPVADAANAYLQAARKAKSQFNKLLAARASLENAGFRGDAQAVPLGPHINGNPLLADDLLDRLDVEIQRHANQVSRPPANSPQPAQSAAPASEPAVAAAKSKPNRQRITPGDARTEQAPALPDELEALESGTVRCVVLRSGYPDSENRGCQQGRKIILPESTARLAAARGAIEIVEESSKKVVDAPQGEHHAVQ